jgi:hypothetical protein
MNARHHLIAGFWVSQLDKPCLWAAKGSFFVDERGQVKQFLEEDSAFDCSGLMTCGLLKVGAPDHRADWNAQAMADLFPPIETPELGDFGFYGSDWQHVIHVVGVLAGGHIVSADGATSSVRTLSEAKKKGAKVRFHNGPLYRTGFLGYRRNYFLEKDKEH